MIEFHIRQPIWYGDRTQMFVGLARRRLLDGGGQPRRCNALVYVDYKVRDNLDPTLLKLMYRYPFIISCEKAITYPIQVLTDYQRTRLHIIPVDHMTVYKTRRQRVMPQAEFKMLTMLATAMKEVSQ
jgi:hypothetical protein